MINDCDCISEKSNFHIILSDNFTVDASESLDPDMDPTEIEKMSLEYEWYCKQRNESANLNNYTKIFVTYPKPKHFATTLNKTAFQQWKEAGNQFSGCFGTGIGRLFGDGMVLTINKF